MTLPITIRRVAGLVLAASLAVVMLSGLVVAHADLVTPTPADRSTETQPVTEVSGIYSEAMSPNGASLIVKDASGTTVARGTVDTADDTRMVATPTTPLGTGSYIVEWTSVALDGHVERGTWTFQVAVAATPAPSPVASAAPSEAATPVAVTPSPSTGPTPTPSAGGTTTGSSDSDVILPIIVALIILVVGTAYLLSRRNRPPDPT